MASHLLALMCREADAPVIQGEVPLVHNFLPCNLKGVLLMLPWPPTYHGSLRVTWIRCAPAVLPLSCIRVMNTTDCIASHVVCTGKQHIRCMYRGWSC